MFGRPACSGQNYDALPYDALPAQARTTRLTPEILTYVKTLPGDAGQPVQGNAQRRSIASVSSQANRPREKRRAITSTAQPAQRLRTERTARPLRAQSESSKTYHAVPGDQDAKTCLDVGFQDDTESRPYSHSLGEKVQVEKRCLVF